MSAPPPLSNIRIIEFAGLAPGPFAGKLLADYGASVLRIDRHTSSTAAPTLDLLAENKRSIRVNLKSSSGIALVMRLAETADVLIDPFRPGVLEKLGLGPEVLCPKNPRLIYARMVGFRRDGKYKDMAGHDINYIAVSGALSMLGRADGRPYAPANILGDFAGGGLMCFVGILLALFSRASSGKGQVVEANMVDGSAYLVSFPRFLQHLPSWSAPRGKNLLDGGAPFYDTYRTKDGGYMAVGALETQFYSEFVSRMFTNSKNIPDREDPRNWPALRELFTNSFLEKTRKEWEDIYDGTDACVTPVKSNTELKGESYQQAPPVVLKSTPAVQTDGWGGVALKPGQGGKKALEEWWGLKEGHDWVDGAEGCRVKKQDSKL